MRIHSSIRATMAAICIAFVANVALADIPTNYYKSAYNLTTSDLKTALSKIVSPHQQVQYNSLPTYFQQTDLYPNSNQWWDMYGNAPIYLPWNGSLLNREHSLPKSWWGGLTTTPAYTDLNHLYPGEATANQKKSNYPLGEVRSQTWTNGVSTLGVGVNSGGAAYVFEPADEYKGDFARTYFYMVTCYQDLNWVTTWQVRNGTYPSLQQWAIDLLLKWHRADPVSQKEQNRNEKVYDIQNNRNPFIDYPELAEYIWGNKMGQAWSPSSSSTPATQPQLIAPTNNTVIDFGQVAIGKSVTRQMLVKGSDLTSNLRLIVGGTNATCFGIQGGTSLSNGGCWISISYTAANSQNGTWVTMTYTPTAIGTHTGTGNFTGGGIGGCGMQFRGECLAVPSLTKPTNVRAEEVTDTSYVATWDVPDNEVVDYWVITRNIYKGNTVTTKEEIAESPTWPVDDFNGSDHESFSVHSVRLGYDSPESELVVVNHTTAIDGVWADEPLVIESFGHLVRVRCSTPQTALTVWDVMGRMVKRIDYTVSDLYEFTLPTAGVYFITTNEHRHPIKTIVN